MVCVCVCVFVFVCVYVYVYPLFACSVPTPPTMFFVRGNCMVKLIISIIITKLLRHQYLECGGVLTTDILCHPRPEPQSRCLPPPQQWPPPDILGPSTAWPPSWTGWVVGSVSASDLYQLPTSAAHTPTTNSMEGVCTSDSYSIQHLNSLSTQNPKI